MASFLKDKPSMKATIIGQAALVIWSLSACCTMALSGIPAFEILSGIFISGFVASSIINTIKGNWSDASGRPKYLILAGILGIIGNDIFYILSFKHAPAIQVDLIVYLWPMMVLILSSLFLNEKTGIHHIFACILAFLGVYILLTADSETGLFHPQYLIGYACAFASALLWSIYIIISRKYAKSTPELFAIYCGVGAIFSLVMHFNFETTVMPSFWQGVILIVMGVATHSFAYYGWDFAIKRGHFKLLSILPYGNPILSVLALIFFGFADLTIEVLISTLMVFAAGAVAGLKAKRLSKIDSDIRVKNKV